MKIPSSEKYIKRESESDIYDSDVTLLTDYQEHKYKKNHHKSQIDCTETGTETSQSFLKPRKKKRLEISGEGLGEGDGGPVKKKKKESIDFTPDMFNQSFSDESLNSSPRKSKEKNRKPESSGIEIKKEKSSRVILNDELTKRDKEKELNFNIFIQNDKSEEFSSQEIFNEEFLNFKQKKPRKNLKKDGSNDLMSSGNRIEDQFGEVISKGYLKKKNIKEEDEGPNLNTSRQSDNTLEFRTQDIYNHLSSEEFAKFTPKNRKKKRNKKNKKRNRSDIIDVCDSGEFICEINDQHDIFPSKSYKRKNKKRNKLNKNDYILSRADNVHDSCTDSSQVVSEENNYDMSGNNLRIFPELFQNEIKMLCQHKEIGTSTSTESGQNQYFYCQFCQSSDKNVNKNDCKTLGNETISSSRCQGTLFCSNKTEKLDGSIEKIKKKKRKHKKYTNETKTEDSVSILLHKYLTEKGDILLEGDDSKNTELTELAPSLSGVQDGTSSGFDKLTNTTEHKTGSETAEGGTDTVKKKKRKKSSDSCIQNNGSDKIVDSNNLLSNHSTIEKFGNNTFNGYSAIGKKESVSNLAKDKRKSSSEAAGDNAIKNESANSDKDLACKRNFLAANPSNETYEDMGYSGGVSRDSSIVKKEGLLNIRKEKKKSSSDASDDNVIENVSTSSDEDLQYDRSILATNFLNVTYDDINYNEDSSNTPEKAEDQEPCDTSEIYSKFSNGDNVYFVSSDDSDDGAEVDIDKLDVMRSALKSLKIEVYFPIPKLHEICHRASKLTLKQRRKVAEENLTIKSGKFLKAEDEKIIENWRKFIKMYNFDDVPELFYSLDKKYISLKEKQNFLYFLSQGLNERTPFSVYRRFKLLMLQKKRGRFTEEEDKYIMDKMEETGCCRSYVVEIAGHLQRPHQSVEKRIKKLKDKHTRKIRWKKGNLAAFIKYLLKVTGTDPDAIGQLKNRHISTKEWLRLSKKLDGVPCRILQRAWFVQIHPMLFIPDPCCDLREVKLKLINMFHENKEYDWRGVQWANYVPHFDGLTTSRLYTLLKTAILFRVPVEKRKSLKSCIKELYKLTVDDLRPHFVYKIKYEDGAVTQLVKKEDKKRKK